MQRLSKAILLLRTEIGVQVSIAHKELEALQELPLPEDDTKQRVHIKSIAQAVSKRERLEKLAHALGAIQLGDIEDRDI